MTTYSTIDTFSQNKDCTRPTKTDRCGFPKPPVAIKDAPTPINDAPIFVDALEPEVPACQSSPDWPSPLSATEGPATNSSGVARIDAMRRQGSYIANINEEKL